MPANSNIIIHKAHLITVAVQTVMAYWECGSMHMRTVSISRLYIMLYTYNICSLLFSEMLLNLAILNLGLVRDNDYVTSIIGLYQLCSVQQFCVCTAWVNPLTSSTGYRVHAKLYVQSRSRDKKLIAVRWWNVPRKILPTGGTNDT